MTRQYSRFPGAALPASPPVPAHRYARHKSPQNAVQETAPDSTFTQEDHDIFAAQIAREAPSSKLLLIFMIAVVLPLEFQVADLLITPARALLLLLFPWVFLRWISGSMGGIKVMDLCIFSYGLWIMLALYQVHGLERFQFLGISFIETFSAYLIGRTLVRNARQFETVTKFIKVFLIIFIPTTLCESILANPIHLELFGKITETYPWISHDPAYGQRMGLWRAQGVFPHPILFGVFNATAFPLLYYTYNSRMRRPGGLKMSWPAIPMTFLSLSSGAFLSLLLSGGLAIWDAMFKTIKGHWMILFGIFFTILMTIDLLSDRSAIEVFISYAAFSAHNGYMRINIFIYGMENVWANPLFGLGLNNWERPRWMHAASVDNYWLLQAMRYGIPAFLFMVATWIVGIIGTSRLKLHTFRAQAARRAWVIALVATTLSLMTVHMWGSLYIFMLFVLGMGAWLGDFANSAENVPDRPDNNTPAPEGRRRG